MTATGIHTRSTDCPRCGWPLCEAVETYLDGTDDSGNVRTADRVIGHAGTHTCQPLHHAASMPAGRWSLDALIDGERQTRVTERHASTAGRHTYTERRPERLSDVHSGTLACVSYRPAARFAVTTRGTAYVVRAS